MSKKFVQKIILAALTGSMILSMTACTNSTANNNSTANMSQATASANTEPSDPASANSSEYMTGGWEINSGALPITENTDAKKAFENAIKDVKGAKYEAIALLGQQVVAGTNYSILVRKTSSDSDASSDYEIITVYEDLDGKAEITDSKVLLDDAKENADGGFTVNTGDIPVEDNEDVKAAVDKALDGLVGANYESVAYLGSQVVAGTNYLVLMRITPVVPDAVPQFGLVTFYQDLDGNVEMSSEENIELGTN